ncbi:hypothetical protein H0H93_003589 [Arthromyces matolae]|nr:hypothetical protein H0H93_003589 [Arthromyces matolae]
MPGNPTPRPCPPNTPRPPPPGGPNTVTVEIQEGYEGVISGLSRSGRSQRVVVKGLKRNGEEIFRSNLVGNGENLPLKSEFDQSPGGIAFGPFDQLVTLQFTIEHANSANSRSFRPSRVISPITVNKSPSNNHRHFTQVTTILSEDGDDADFDDAIITVFAFK